MPYPVKSHVSNADVVARYRAGATTYEIAEALGVSQSTIVNRLKDASEPRRPRRQRNWPAYTPTSEIIAMYKSGLSSGQIGKQIGIDPACVATRLRRAGVKMRTQSDYGYYLAGPKNHRWKGGRIVSDGYVWISIGNKRRKGEHRIVMEQSLGRPLRKGEIVHHLNGIRHDNRPENLVVTTLKDHEHYTYVKHLQARIRELETIIPRIASGLAREG